MKLTSYAVTDIGLKRKVNQDAFLKDDDLRLYIIADGMGGHRGGEVASQLVIEVLQKFCKENSHMIGRDLLDSAINMGCKAIYSKAMERYELAGMGTTLLAMLFQNNTVYIAQVGDSRAYLLHHDLIWQITEDHSLLNEEIRAGRLDLLQASHYQFKNVITRSVGYENHVIADIYRREVRAMDTFVFCTDGLSGLVQATEIAKEINSNGLETGLKNLISLANFRGGDDNITVLACHVSALD